MNKAKLFTIFAAAWFAATPSVHASNDMQWNILDKSMANWDQNDGNDVNQAWKVTKSYITAQQEDGYVHIEKLTGADGFISPTAYPTTSKDIYTFDIRAKVNACEINDTETAFEAAQISVAVAGKKMKIYLKHGDETNGYLCFTPAWQHDPDEKIQLNTSDWHTYRFVYDPVNYAYDLYIDDLFTPVASKVKTHYDGTKNYVMIGADKDQYCNMDVEFVRMGTGNFSLKPQINNIQVSSDSHVEGNERTITVTINTSLIENGTKVQLALFDSLDNQVTEATELSVEDNKATSPFTIPASINKGIYTLKAMVTEQQANGSPILPQTLDYYIVEPSPITLGLLPEVSPVGFIIETEDYKIPSPTNEYIFPVVIDTKKHVDSNGNFANGSKPKDRYYWYHTPHNDPGGMYLYTAPTLDGPWTEQGVRASLEWATENGLKTPHISGCHILWNDVYQKYFMYFHGNNNQTNYATSDDLWNWTFGGKLVQYDDFSFSSREASYAKVFEYEVPGLNNKYVMMLMINENNSRTIYWAHSTDGIDWKAVRKPLISPKTGYKKVPGTNTRPSYNNNVSAPYFMIAGGRYFVLFHSSAGNISVVEIGEKFDMEVHWGTYMNCKDVVITEDEDGNPAAVSRVASPFFIQDDYGTWYMFFEAGHRLGSNTAYAKGETPPTTQINQTRHNTLFEHYKKGENVIVYNPLETACSYELYNPTGILLQAGTLQPGDNSFDSPEGLNLLRITTEDEIQTLKIQ